MSTLVVVDEPNDWLLATEYADVCVLPSRRYLTEGAWGKESGARVFNLCSACHYQSLGYYVSLLAEARSQQPWPRATTIEDLQSPSLTEGLTAPLAPLVEHSLASVAAEDFALQVYFGHTLGGGHAQLAAELFTRLQTPLLRARFERIAGRWQTSALHLIGLGELGDEQRRFALQAAATHFAGQPRARAGKPARPFGIAILHDPDGIDVPSNPEALAKFSAAASALGMRPEFITAADFARLGEFDALFIRDTTYVNHYTYRFARRAQNEGLVVIDDPDSILKCNNKVYLGELLAHHQLPTPRTLVIHRDNIDQIVPRLALPCVLKQPDSSFSVGVVKVDGDADLHAQATALLRKSELIVAQEWLPTEFDWRVGILDRRAIFVCKYHMAAGHWQIIDRDAKEGRREGRTEALTVGEAPAEVVRIALQAAELIGDGFYGVDIKQSGQRYCIIEINDNPNVDAGNEDGVLGSALYRETMGVFLRRLTARHRGDRR